MSHARRPHPDWCRLDVSPGQGPALVCQGCGARHPLRFPLAVSDLAALAHAFERLHAACGVRGAAVVALPAAGRGG